MRKCSRKMELGANGVITIRCTGAAGRAAFGDNDFRCGPVNVAVIQ